MLTSHVDMSVICKTIGVQEKLIRFETEVSATQNWLIDYIGKHSNKAHYLNLNHAYVICITAMINHISTIPRWLDSSVAITLQWFRRGHGFQPHLGLNFLVL